MLPFISIGMYSSLESYFIGVFENLMTGNLNLKGGFSSLLPMMLFRSRQFWIKKILP